VPSGTVSDENDRRCLILRPFSQKDLKRMAGRAVMYDINRIYLGKSGIQIHTAAFK
jgi:hypothetical protein